MSEKLKVGKYYEKDELICGKKWDGVCWVSDFCDTGVLTKECLRYLKFAIDRAV